MQYIVDAQEMKDCDRRTIEYYQVPEMVLMERAALAVVQEVENNDYNLTEILIVCGTGNNGGDGIAVARLLFQKGYNVKTFLTGPEEKATRQTVHQLTIARQYGMTIYEITDSKQQDSQVTVEEFKEQLEKCSLVIDGIFGVGLSREVGGNYKKIIDLVNVILAPVISIDIPSGIDASTGKILGCGIKAHRTVTFAFNKAGLVLYPGAEYAGKIKIADIGITKDSFNERVPQLYTYEKNEILKLLPSRAAYSNKGTFGKVTLIVGSKGMAGAAYLAGMAAYRTGCGLVRIVTPEENREILQNLVPEAVITTYNSSNPNANEPDIRKALEWADVIGIGSGLGTDETAEYLVSYVLQHTNKPLVIDGDGLNVLSLHKEFLNDRKEFSPEDIRFDLSKQIAITPHLGEMSRLTNKSIGEIQEHIIETAMDFANEYYLYCVLKDARTVVAGLNEPAYLNLTGNHGMATGGSGDVLMGIICSLAAQGMHIKDASVAGVYLHGAAGDAACVQKGARTMTARDLLEHISDVIK